MKELEEALMVKYNADTTIKSLTNGLFLAEAPQGTAYPYIVYSYPSGNPEWTFNNDMKIFVIQFKIHDSNTSAVTLNLIYKALHDLFDWCTLTIDSWNLTYMKPIFENLFRVDDKWQYVIQFRIRIQKI